MTLTVSDVKFVPLSCGTCPECNRPGLELGRVNLPDVSSARLVCIDCHFGPPPWLWQICPACGYRQPGNICHKCGTATVPDHCSLPPDEADDIEYDLYYDDDPDYDEDPAFEYPEPAA